MKNPIKKDIRSLSLEQLESFFDSIGEQSFRAKQLYNWLWKKSMFSFLEMTNLPLKTRQILKKNFVINKISVDFQQKSKDGTIKNSIKLHDGYIVESVLIPTEKRTTACVSSQVGCSLDCGFCATSLLKRMRNLNPDEIFDQVVALNKQSLAYYKLPLTNIVFMGMGEPLMNYKNVNLAIKKIIEQHSGKNVGSISKKTTFVVAGENMGPSKLQKAEKLNVPLLSEDEFIKKIS